MTVIKIVKNLSIVNLKISKKYLKKFYRKCNFNIYLFLNIFDILHFKLLEIQAV